MGPTHTSVPSEFAPTMRVLCLTSNGEIKPGVIVIRCGMRNQGDWIVKLDDGPQIAAFEHQLEREPIAK